MLPKALIISSTFEWLESQNIPANPQSIQVIFNRSQDLYKHLKNHPDFLDLLPNISYNQFMQALQDGVYIAQDPQAKMFRKMGGF
jgi:hypothetical protein